MGDQKIGRGRSALWVRWKGRWPQARVGEWRFHAPRRRLTRCTPRAPRELSTPVKPLHRLEQSCDYEQVGRAFESAGFPPKVITKPPAHTRIVVAGARRAVDCRKSDSVLHRQLPCPERTGSWRSRLGAGTSGDGVEGRLQDLPPRHRKPFNRFFEAQK